MLDFIADNYLWFIVLGAVLLAIALILLFTRKKPIKEEIIKEEPKNENNVDVPEIVEVTGDTETLEIVDEVVEENTVTSEPMVAPENVVEKVEPFEFEEPVMVNVNEDSETFTQDTNVENLKIEEEQVSENVNVDNFEEVKTSDMEIVFDEPKTQVDADELLSDTVVLDKNVQEEQVFEPVIMNDLEEVKSKEPEIVFEEPKPQVNTDELFVEPVVLDNNVQEEPQDINVGNVVMPEENVNTDNVPTNNEQEDIWKF